MAKVGSAISLQPLRAFLFLAFFAITKDSVLHARELHAGSDITDQNDTSICKGVDIRNSLDTFKRLEGCRVVEGFVQILLFDNVDETQLSQISFPELTEITDYLLMYRVNGLRSIGQLFPNLAVIRGQTLFYGYAFVVFEMSSLQEVALYSLTDVTRGLIRIDKNPSLCFVNSIDWDLITHEKGDNFIKSIKPENECPICPGEENVKQDKGVNEHAITACPKMPQSSSSTFDRSKHLCWNRQHCQKICPSHCRSCDANGKCCSDNCIGGCSVDDPNACTVCRNLSMGSGSNRQCMSHCPDQYYEYLGRRCIKREECENMTQPLHARSSELEYPYKIFNKTCILECPTNYMSDNKQHTCKPCGGRCKKECPGVNVDSITLAKQLRGCTHITGSLEIQLRGGRNVVNELEENLSMIEEINGYLKIVRSFPLVSLNFLKNLKRIRGQSLESQKYVFIVLDNQNLQELWDWRNRTLKIDQGRLFFHFNPKLCLKEIEMLQKKANLSSFTDLEVASNSNGDKIACNVERLNVSVDKINDKAVTLNWENFKMMDQRKLLGYVVYLIEAPHKNVTLYDGRDACGGDGWRVDDVTVSEDDQMISHPLTSLKPYTQYAFYVRTYTIATERRGAQSNISYFRTLPSVPSNPVGLQVTSDASDALKFVWQPPIFPNGNVTHYIVAGKKHKNAKMDDMSELDYCTSYTAPQTHIIAHSSSALVPSVTNSQGGSNNSSESCACEEKKSSNSAFHEGEEYSRIKFEDDLQNEVYVKKEGLYRRRREVYDSFSGNGDSSVYIPSEGIQNSTEADNKTWESFSFKVYGKTDFYLTNMHHYTVYDIYVQACRETEGEEDKKSNCSSTSMVSARTLMKEGADRISRLRIANKSQEMVAITWDEPQDPNGIILSYSIEYRRLDRENSKPTQECIPHNHFLNHSRIHVLKKLPPGNYSLRVSALTSAAKEEYSPYIYFHFKEPSSNHIFSWLGPVLAIVIFGIVAIAAYIIRRKTKADRESMRLIPSVNPEYVPSVYVPDEWEVPRKNIELIQELGQGSFGMVYEGLAREIKGLPQVKCAVKTVNEHATNRERLEFLNEASVMKAFDTAHVVRLLGVVSQGQPTLVIMELMAHGDLKSYLRSHRPDADIFDPALAKQPPSLRQILQMAIEISDGMAYLSAKKFVHRDLAARNCMVSENLTVKIGDFGMTRDIYETDYYRKGTKGLLPVRWMAPESLKDGVFTSYSDVWSYGVVLWEMATLASQPYQGLSNDQVLRYVIDGGVMERPENCPDKLYTLMRYCWQHKPSSRPSFTKLCSLLIDDAAANFVQVSFYHSDAGREARNSRPTPSPSQDDPSTPLRIAGDVDTRFSLHTNSEESDEELGPCISYPSIPVETKDGLTTPTANGYVGGCPNNGAATTQC